VKSVSDRRRRTHLWTGAVLLWLASHGLTGAMGMAPEPHVPLRCIVELNSTDSPQSAETLRVLSEHAQAPVSYVDRVSGTVHIYIVHIAKNQDVAAVIARLRSAPQVLNITLDQQRQRH
jgi:hypothetical protein